MRFRHKGTSDPVQNLWMVVIVVVVPVPIIVPLMVASVPPAVIFLPAALALGVEVAAARLGLGAALAVMANSFVQAGLSLLDAVAAFVVGVSLSAGNSHEQGSAQDCCGGQGSAELAKL